ncbi:glutathione S-transferase 1-like isoform X1 [Daphnia pulicaria]|uniref:glutathione S-transferase 1-like isoform X1 n=2 Tax=Daphnia pulicaria TaxID=35523 RepID=UPI001EE9DF4A|nr:glutathione S-transferase 1-like isoform X1 [Daphnia pulicaria]
MQSKMPAYKLHYFNLRGRAELARLILNQAGVEFEDVRFERAEWPALKASMPFAQVPVLEVDGQMLAQSNTISRYLARQHGLAGKDEWEQAQADMYADNINDLMTGMRPAFLEKDADKQKELYQKFMTDNVAPHVAIVEKQLETNGSGHLVGKELTWADLAYYGYFAFLVEKFGEDFLKDAPLLKALIAMVEALPNIKKWVESRPKTEI